MHCQSGQCLSGTPVLVPDDVAGETAELPSPGHEAALAAVRELHALIPGIRDALSAAYTAGKTQERTFTSSLHAAVASEQGVKGAKTAARLKTIGETSAAVLAEAEKNKAVHAQALTTIAKDLDHFLTLHGADRK